MISSFFSIFMHECMSSVNACMCSVYPVLFHSFVSIWMHGLFTYLSCAVMSIVLHLFGFIVDHHCEIVYLRMDLYWVSMSFRDQRQANGNGKYSKSHYIFHDNFSFQFLFFIRLFCPPHSSFTVALCLVPCVKYTFKTVTGDRKWASLQFFE